MLRYENWVGRFLEDRFDVAGDRFVTDLAGKDMVTFMLRETARVRVDAAKGRVAELRSLLRFLYVQGLTRSPGWGARRSRLASRRDRGARKARRHDRLPLPCDVADALSGYLCQALAINVDPSGVRDVQGPEAGDST